ncbi:MAG TPA: hypothetical protein VGL58_19010 [Caulobacteraceae bacterium]|jgi:predicted nucleic acid-binding protein
MADTAGGRGLVLDTSVWINLLATGAAEAIIAALAQTCYAPEPVAAELKRDPITGELYTRSTHPLWKMEPHVAVVALDRIELEFFLGLVGASTIDALGDGEAASIAVAARRGLDLVLDDRKARRIVRERFGEVQLHWTVDLLRAPAVITGLGEMRATVCFENARRHGRMHIPKN